MRKHWADPTLSERLTDPPVAIGIFDSGNQTLIDNSEIFATNTAYVGVGNTSIIQDSALNVNAPAGNNAFGINLVGSDFNLTIDNTQILVNNLSNNQNTFGIVIASNNNVTVNNSNITVTASNNVTNAANTYDITNSGNILIDSGSLNANSNGNNVGIVNPSSSFPVTILFDTVCQVNDNVVTCP